ncbi:MAG: RNA 2',3'-cyclic phosphodiesterase [Rhodospirillales bacterium]|jgi:2'-5' RNA ligase|nr:RNA 2',3'-cyclic phosphodiesterase [Rhodospirillales bacterium]MDP6805372.1 RNA 2',3'-cyclic phosphodiesterase [Rhodospirillales bacterium]
MERLFVGIVLPADVRERLGGLCAGLAGTRWVAAENMHVTLRFIGDVDRTALDDVHAALSSLEAPAFALRLAGIGCFESRRRVRAIWAGIEKSPSLNHLAEKVESAIVRAGFAPEGRKFKGHVTLARLKNVPVATIGGYLESHSAFAAGPFSVESFALFSSRLGKDGPVYERLANYALAAVQPNNAGSSSMSVNT